jgi:hypothetical protein
MEKGMMHLGIGRGKIDQKGEPVPACDVLLSAGRSKQEQDFDALFTESSERVKNAEADNRFQRAKTFPVCTPFFDPASSLSTGLSPYSAHGQIT